MYEGIGEGVLGCGKVYRNVLDLDEDKRCVEGELECAGCIENVF